LATFAAIRLASSRVSSFSADRSLARRRRAAAFSVARLEVIDGPREIRAVDKSSNEIKQGLSLR
jgi:hypothetical protein